MVADDVQRQRVVDDSGTPPKLWSTFIANIMLERNTATFIVRAAATSSASIMDCVVSPCSSTLALIGALTSITKYVDVDLLLSGLLPQLAFQKAASLEPPCL